MIATRRASVIRGARTLLYPIDLTLEAGQTCVVIGPNGAGKSTLMKLLSGEIRPSSGAVALDGRPLRTIPPRRLAARRALLAQANESGFGFTVRELAALGLRMLDLAAPLAERVRLVERAVDEVGLDGLQNRMVAGLSGGERQRAHLARVLVQLWAGERLHGPGVLLLDEPVSAQDLAHQLHILEIARRHAEAGGAVGVVLHDLNWAARAGDRLVVLNRGSVYAEGPPAEVLTAAMLAEVFDVALQPGATPGPGRPFILPQLAARRPSADIIVPSPSQRRSACTSP